MFLESCALAKMDFPGREYRGLQGAADWIGDTIAGPLINAAFVEPYNTAARAVEDLSCRHLSPGKITPLPVNKPQTYSAAWFVESAAGGLGSLVPFVIAARATGCSLRRLSNLLPEGDCAASILASERLAQLAGAGIYAGMKQPQAGESRLGKFSVKPGYW